MRRELRVRLYVAAVVAGAALALLLSWPNRVPLHDLWGAAVIACAGFVFLLGSTQLRDGGGSTGSLTFVSQLTAGLLFGPFWGGVLSGAPAALAEIRHRKPLLKGVFNVGQLTLAVVTAFHVYASLGGSFPPRFLSSAPGDLSVATAEIGAFLAAALTYFVINSLLVSGAVAISSARPIAEVWSRNTFWVLRFDLAASLVAVGLVWLYLKLGDAGALGKAAFLVVLFFLGVLRRGYIKLNQTQHLLDELGKAHALLGQNVRDVLAMMVKSIEARDPYTSGHSRRVGALAKAIATEYGLPDEEIQRVENAALLHDVGKIHAEFAPLLSKEGRLAPEEWEIMKTHPARGAELVGLFAAFREHVEPMVRYHHERWDGKGYPSGLSEESIPLGARIIMISDTIDAMTTDRPYRKALGFEVVVAELQKYRGIQFDPKLVDATIRSVTVRRMVSDPAFLAEKASGGASSGVLAKEPLRSQNSFWEGLRSGG